MSSHATDLRQRHQQCFCHEYSSTIRTDELVSDVSKIIHDEEESLMGGSTAGGGGGDTCSSSHAWNAYPPEIDEGFKDFDQAGEVSSDSFPRYPRLEQRDEVEDMDRFLYSDEYLQHTGDDFGDGARPHPQSLQEDEFKNDSGGEVDDFYYEAYGTIDGGNGRKEGNLLWSPEQAVPNMMMTCPDRSDDLIHEKYLDDRESIVGQGSGGDFGWEFTDEDADEYPSTSLSSGWSSFNVAEISYRNQENQQQQQGRLHDDGEGVGCGVPDLKQDMDKDVVFFATTTTTAELFRALQQNDIFVDVPPISYEPTTQSSLSSGDQTNTAYNPTATATSILPISHSSSSTPTPPPQQPQQRQRSEACASASKPASIPYTTSKTTEYMSTTERPRDWILEQLEGLASQFLYHLSMEERPVIDLACRNRMDSVVYDQEVGVIRRRRRRVDDEVAVEVLSVQGDGADAVGSLLEEVVVTEMTERVEEDDKESEADMMETARSRKRPTAMVGSGLKGKRRKKIDGRTINETKTSGSDDTFNATTSSRVPLPLPPLSLPLSPFTKRSVYGSKRTRRILRATELIHNNVSKDAISSKRDMYYRDVLAFGSQRAVDGIVEDLACTFEVPRANLNVVAGTRSVVFGSVRMLVRALGGKQRGTSGGERMENEKGEELLPWLHEEIANSSFSKTRTLSCKQSHEHQHNQGEGDKRTKEAEAEADEEDPLDSRFSQTSYNTLVPVPVQFSDIVEIEIHPRTRFILVIEKEATFSNLISLGFCEPQGPGQGQGQGPCILLTSKGFPDQVARQLVKALEEMVKDGVYLRRFPVPPFDSGGGDNGCSNDYGISESSSFEFVSLYQSPSPVHVPRSRLDIPILALVDCDPHGIEIYLTYRCGSIQCAYENANLAVPVLKCLGQVPSDWDLFFNPPPLTTRTTSDKPSSLEQEPVEMSHHEQEQSRTRFREAFIPLTDKDRKNLERLMTTHPYIRQHARWRGEIERMLGVDAKTELQSLHQLDLTCGSSASGVAVIVGGSEGEGGGSRGAEGAKDKENVNGAGGLMVYLKRKLQDPQSWL